jgi:hypothetical protein
MAHEPVYESALPWDPQPPTTLVISCVDGRWYRHFHDFVTNRLKTGAATAFIAVAGGIEPLTLMDHVPKDFNFFRRRLEPVIESHGIRRIIAIAHEDCAWYKSRRIGPIKIDLRERQVHDLQRAAANLREMFPGVTVEAYYASLSGPASDRVVFEAVE